MIPRILLNQPPPPTVQVRTIWRPQTAGRAVEVVVLSPAPLSLWTHWQEGRTYPCLVQLNPDGAAVETPCPCCQAGMRRVWRGYLGAQSARRGTIGIVEITRGAVQSCPALWEDRGKLRGRKLVLRRQGSAKNGRVLADLAELLPPDSADLPPPPEVWETLAYIWGRNGFYEESQ